jgi:hypothetical protein
MAMKKWIALLLIMGIILLLSSLAIYAIRIGVCYPPTLPERSPFETAKFRQDYNLVSSRVIQFSGFLVLFIPVILLVANYWLVRPHRARVQRGGPLVSILLLTLFDSLLLAELSLLSYPEVGTSSDRVALVVVGFGLAWFISLHGIWQWKRWGLLAFQGMIVIMTINSGASALPLLPAGIAIFSPIYLTLVPAHLRSFID